MMLAQAMETAQPVRLSPFVCGMSRSAVAVAA